jgi:hypothetical protein
MDLLGFVILVLVAGSMLFLLTLVGRRSWIAYEAKRRDAAVTELRPAAIELIEDVADPPPLRGLDAEVFAELLGGYSLVVRGAPRERIAAYFESTGAVDEHGGVRRPRSHSATWAPRAPCPRCSARSTTSGAPCGPQRRAVSAGSGRKTRSSR